MPTLRLIRARLKANADPQHAEFHRDYHKSEQRFYGLRAPQLYAVLDELIPKRTPLQREEGLPLVDELLASPWHEEVIFGLLLLARIEAQLTARDIPYLRRVSDGLSGWGQLDTFALYVLSPLALRLGEPGYKQVRKWSRAEHIWTRRASVLVHVIPARRGQLNDKYSWPTFEELLPERDFFIRKAIGWALRECCKHYPQQVADFLLRVGERASGLTRREGARNLPPKLRAQVLGP